MPHRKPSGSKDDRVPKKTSQADPTNTSTGKKRRRSATAAPASTPGAPQPQSQQPGQASVPGAPVAVAAFSPGEIGETPLKKSKTTAEDEAVYAQQGAVSGLSESEQEEEEVVVEVQQEEEDEEVDGVVQGVMVEPDQDQEDEDEEGDEEEDESEDEEEGALVAGTSGAATDAEFSFSVPGRDSLAVSATSGAGVIASVGAAVAPPSAAAATSGIRASAEDALLSIMEGSSRGSGTGWSTNSPAPVASSLAVGPTAASAAASASAVGGRPASIIAAGMPLTEGKLARLLRPLVKLRSLLEPVVSEFSTAVRNLDAEAASGGATSSPTAASATAAVMSALASVSSAAPGGIMSCGTWGTLTESGPAPAAAPAGVPPPAAVYALSLPMVTVGRSSQCAVRLKEKGYRSLVCRMYATPPALESMCDQVVVADKPVPRGDVVFLKDGDMISFPLPDATTPPLSFVFRLDSSAPQQSAGAAAADPKKRSIEEEFEAMYGSAAPGSSGARLIETSPFALVPVPAAPAAASPASIAIPQQNAEERLPSDISALAGSLPPVPQHPRPSADPQVTLPPVPMELSDGSGTAPTESALRPQVPPLQLLAPPELTVSFAKSRFRKLLQDKVCKPEDLNDSLESFPYFLSGNVQRMLVSSAFVYLRKPEFAKFVTDLSSLSRKILVSGPSGTELYQEALVKALAKHFGAATLAVESADLEPRAIRPQVPTAPAPQQQHQQQQQQLASATAAARGLAAAVLGSLGAADLSNQSSEDEDDEHMLGEPHSLFLAAGGAGPGNNPVFREGRGVIGRSSFKRDDRVRFLGTSSVALACISQPKGQKEPRGPPPGARGNVVVAVEESKKAGVQFDVPIPGGGDLGGLCKEGHGYFVDCSQIVLEDDQAEDESAALEALAEVLSESAPAVLLVKNAEKTILASHERYACFKKLLTDITKSNKAVIVVATTTFPVESCVKDKSARGPGAAAQLFGLPKGGGHAAIVDFSFLDHLRGGGEERGGMGMPGASSFFGAGGGSAGGVPREVAKSCRILAKLFPTRVPVIPPKDSEQLAEWREKIERDVEMIKTQTNRGTLSRALSKVNVTISDDLPNTALKKQIFGPDGVDKIVGWAISDHLQRTEAAEVRGDQLLVSGASIERAIRMLEANEPDARQRSLMEVETDNDFEKRLLAEVIPPEEVNLSFDDIGALDETKKSLRELVMLPLQRPELFRRGNLTKPCKGILLFGPPGTGKTMLAKAVATESGANFLNVTMSSIASKWFGEGEKYVKALFTLASKISPSVIFVDEVDSILGKRERAGEHEAMRKIKNEFMTNWDGLRTRQSERVLVLAATNRPMDLDDAVLRRLNKKLLVDLPTAENREKILKVILHGEELDPTFDIAALAKKTEGFSGSDLKNLCVMAAHQPIRELLEQERQQKEDAAKAKRESGAGVATVPASPAVTIGPAAGSTSTASATIVTPMETEAVVVPVAGDKKRSVLRPLKMDDFEKSLCEVSKSVHEDAFSLGELRKWNEMYGDNGSRSRDPLSYFL